jgi:carboxymethylenebutenolidase
MIDLIDCKFRKMGEVHMGLHTEWIHYGNSQFKGYLAHPSRAIGSLPAIIVIQEIWGVDGHIEDVTRRFAQAGYVVFAPDLYAKDGKRPDELSFDRLEALKHFLDTIPPTAWRNTEERESYLLKLPQPDQQQVRESVQTVFGTVLGNVGAGTFVFGGILFAK